MGFLSTLGSIAGAVLGPTMGVDPMTGAAIGGSLGGAIEGGQKQEQAAGAASQAQTSAAQQGINEQRRQFDLTQNLLQPYTQAGAPALQQQQAFLGLGGIPAQQQAIQGIEQSPQMQAMMQQGENAMLQNASATGGLRGGNLQGALAQFRPQLLNQLINQQYERLGGLTSLGQQSAAGVGTAGMQTGANIANLLGQQGEAQATGIMGKAAGQQMQSNAIPQAIGAFMGANRGGVGGGGYTGEYTGGGGQMDFMGFKF